MNKLLLSTAIALGLSAGAAHAKQYDVTNYSLPDGNAYNDVTTTASGASDTPYSYYTGPVTLYVSGVPAQLTVYCVDLNHFLHQTGTYEVADLKTNGEGQTINQFDSNRIGHIAAIGAFALSHGNDNLATAAQAAIWDISYDGDSGHSTSPDLAIQTDINTLLLDKFSGKGYAQELIPVGEGWPDLSSANQAMVMSTGVPEPSSWALMLSGFGLLGMAGMYHKRKSASVAASA